VINLNLKEQTEALLKTLTPREEEVVKMRFDLGDGSEHAGVGRPVVRGDPRADPADRGQGGAH